MDRPGAHPIPKSLSDALGRPVPHGAAFVPVGVGPQLWVAATHSGLLRCRQGAVFVEFLIAFLPLYTFFLCLVQLSLLFSTRLVTEHAAVNAARSAAVVVAEPPGRFPDPANALTSARSKRYEAIRNAALLTLSPLIVNGNIANVDVSFPAIQTPGGGERQYPVRFEPMTETSVSKIRVRIEVDAVCRIGLANRIACPLRGPLGVLVPSTKIRAEAIYPYQGARYE